MGKNIALAAGWTLAIVLGGILYVQLQNVGALQEKLATAQATYESVKDSAARVASLEAKAEALEKTVATLKAASEDGMATAKSPRGTVEVPENFDPAALLKNMLGGGKTGSADTAESGDKKSKNPFAAMFEGEQGEKLMENALPMQVDMQYSALFKELKLTDERKAALREVILEHARAGMAAGVAMMRGEKPPEGFTKPSDDDLLAAVGEILTPEELKQFTEYQETLPERMMRQQFDMQFGMMAGDLPEEVRNRAVDVLVENMLAAQEPETMGRPDFDAMRAAFDNSITQLEQELSPEDAARIRTMIEQQRAGIDMAARMFGAGDSEGDAPTAP